MYIYKYYDMEVQFSSADERKKYHQYIREAAREINENTELLQTLFRLENGTDKHTSNGFGFVENNDPQTATVLFNGFSESEFEETLEILENATADDLGDCDDKKLQNLAENLTEVAQTLRNNSF